MRPLESIQHTPTKVAGEAKNSKSHVMIMYAPKPGGDYHVHLDEPITDASEYRDILQFLATASAEDTFHIYLDGPGGSCSTCVNLIHGIANTEAKVIAYLKGEVNSSHANIFMACHEHVVYPYSLLMVHTFSGGFWGKGMDSLDASSTYNLLTKTLYTDLYEGFLSAEELEKVLEGNRDLYFVGDEIAERIEKRYAIHSKQIEKEEQVKEEAMQAALNVIQEASSSNSETPTETKDG